MIITVTLNPAIDKTAQVDTFVTGGLNRLENVIVDVGGKGINVSKAIKALGGTSLVTGFIAGSNGEWIEKEVANKGLQSNFETIAGNTRINLKVLDKDMNLTELNEAGAPVQKEDIEHITEKIVSLVQPGDIVVLSGSVPPNTPKDIYASLIKEIKEKLAKVILDADGDLFAQGIEAGPNIIKPNTHEICKYFNLPEDTHEVEVISKAKTLLYKGISLIALSMGSKGAVFITADETIVAPGLKIRANSSVGAGDSMVGALAYGLDTDMELIPLIKMAVATSAGAVMTEGTNPPTKEVIDMLIKEVTLECK
jgi:1-phosphofructokinase